jgi:hypothetical protein
MRQMGHRLSNKEERSMSPELVSPGLESVWAGEGEKEVAMAPPQPDPYERPVSQQPEQRRICGLTRRWLFILVAAVLAVAIALGVGLGIGLGTRNHS